MSPSQTSEVEALKQRNTQLDRLAGAFFAAFDNRLEAPDARRFDDLLDDAARITIVQDGKHREMTVRAFVDPRIELLTGGGLTAFHEWETDAQTFVMGHYATRVCRYQKRGMLNGAPYGGSGTKTFVFFLRDDGWRIVSLWWQDDA